MRFMVSVVATLAMVLVASSANAIITFTVETLNVTTSSTDLSLAVDGDVVEIFIFARNSGGGVASLGAGIFGFDAADLTFLGGESGDSWFNDSLFFGVLPSGGIGNTAGVAGGTLGMGIAGSRILDEGDVINDGTTVRVFNGVSSDIPSPDGDGTFDVGADDTYTCAAGGEGCPAGSGDGAHARVVLRVNGGGSAVTIGTDVALLGGHVDGTGAQVGDSDVNVVIQVPEAGSMATGLAAMASVFAIVGIRRR